MAVTHVVESARGAVIALRAVYETMAISAPTVLDATLARMTLARADVRLARWSARLLEQANVTLEVSGRENLTAGAAYVVMSNHQSHYDVPVLFQAFPGALRMVAKTELFRVPVFGPAMTHAGFIEIDRSDRARAIASLSRAKERLARGVSVWIAPEGTRSRTGELLPFKKGGFVLAIETQLPILPVAVAGSREILPKDHALVHAGARVHVRFGTPIVPPGEASGAGERDALMARVRTAIESNLVDARALQRAMTD